MIIYAIRIPTGYYVSFKTEDYRYSGDDFEIKKYFFDGEYCKPSFHRMWGFVSDIPKKISYMKNQPNINFRYRLVDETIESEKFPLEMPQDEVTYTEGYDRLWKSEFKDKYSLYSLISDKQPDIEIEEEFEFKIVLELDEEIKPPSQINYSVWRTNYRSDGTTLITNKDCIHQFLDKIIFPSLVIHQTPCRLTSKESFDIVRKFIQENINPRVAVITSDYAFCFTVQKKIPLSKPYTYKVDINNNLFGGRKRKPKYESRAKNEKTMTVFEMTWSPENYREYTIIPGFEGKDEDDLKLNIDAYLEHIIAVINEPLKECPTCEGVGYLKGDE